MLEAITAKLHQFRIVKNLADLNFTPTPIVAVDIETCGCDKLPGDSPFYPAHGIAGVALGNLDGDACYVVLNDSRDYGGVAVSDFINYWNEKIKPHVKQACLHYSKFDLSFLLQRGMDFSGIRVLDTWMILNIRAQGVYGALKLKDYAREVLKIATGTEEEKDKWMEANKTGDYGDVPVELMAPYACDDVRYTLLCCLTQSTLTEKDWSIHDLYMRNTLHLLAAEKHGIRVDTGILARRVVCGQARMTQIKHELSVHLGAASPRSR